MAYSKKHQLNFPSGAICTIEIDYEKAAQMRGGPGVASYFQSTYWDKRQQWKSEEIPIYLDWVHKINQDLVDYAGITYMHAFNGPDTKLYAFGYKPNQPVVSLDLEEIGE